MSDNVNITPGSGKVVLADLVTDATLGAGVVQMVKIMDGTIDGTNKAAVSAAGLAVDTELPAAAATADNVSNPTVPGVAAYLLAWNPNSSTFYRPTILDGNSDGFGVFAQMINTNALMRAYDGTNLVRLRADAAKNLLVSLATLISGEDTTNNRLLTDHKPASTDSVLETLQTAATATGAGTAVNVKGYRGVTVQVAGTFVGTVTFEGTLDDSAWFAVGLRTVTDATTPSTATAPGAWTLPRDITLSQLRARVSAYTSGSITVTSRKHPR